MTYYGGKEMAAAFRTVRNNTIAIAEEIPADKYSHRATPDRTEQWGIGASCPPRRTQVTNASLAAPADALSTRFQNALSSAKVRARSRALEY